MKLEMVVWETNSKREHACYAKCEASIGLSLFRSAAGVNFAVKIYLTLESMGEFPEIFIVEASGEAGLFKAYFPSQQRRTLEQHFEEPLMKSPHLRFVKK